MNPIVIHIGATKTGSSSLQQYFSTHSDGLGSAGYAYPQAGRGSHGRAAHHNLYYETRTTDVGNDDFVATLGGWHDVIAEIDEQPQTGLISSEAFLYATSEQVQRIAALLGDREVTIVAYLRRRDLWLQSAWNQRARFGRVGLQFGDFFGSDGKLLANYAEALEPWITAFADDCVDVRMYDAIAGLGGVVEDFTAAHLPGVPSTLSADETPRRNSKAGLRHLLAVSLVTSKCRQRLGDEFSLARRSAIRISAQFRDKPDDFDFSPISFEDAIAIQDFFRESDEQLARISTSFRVSEGFTEPRPDDYRNYVDLSEPAALASALLDPEDLRFVERMATEVVRATSAV